jgi:hypothetical protein
MHRVFNSIRRCPPTQLPSCFHHWLIRQPVAVGRTCRQLERLALPIPRVARDAEDHQAVSWALHHLSHRLTVVLIGHDVTRISFLVGLALHHLSHRLTVVLIGHDVTRISFLVGLALHHLSHRLTVVLIGHDVTRISFLGLALHHLSHGLTVVLIGHDATRS